MYKANDYTYETSYSHEDGAYVARVVDFPYIATHGDSAAEAIANAEEVVAMSLADLAKRKQPAPTPRRARE